MKIVYRKAFTAASLAAAAILTVSACSDDASTSATAQPASSTMAANSAAPKPMDQPVDPGANLVGPGCADYAAQNPTGPASVTGMAQDPVAVAASNNPLLTTLTAAVSGKLNPNVNLVDTLNGSEFTVFAPTDAAFAKIDPGHHRQAEDGLEPAEQHPDLSRGAWTGQPRSGDRHTQDGAGW